MSTYSDYTELETFIKETGNGAILVDYRNIPEYPGMVLYLAIHFNIKGHYQLILEWISFGLDFYGDTLQESYMYKFKSLQELLQYLESTYTIRITDIPKKYQFDMNRFPNALRDADQKPLFEKAWQQFLNDFQKGIFLDPALELVYSSQNK